MKSILSPTTRTDSVRTALLLSLSLAFAGACKTGAASGGKAEPPKVQARAPGMPEGPDVQRRMIGDQLVIVRADPENHAELDQLFNHLWTIKDQGAVFTDDQAVALGWTTLWLSQRRAPEGGTYFVVQEPDYAGDAESARSEDLSVTLAVLAAQRRVLELSGTSAAAVDFDQHLLAIDGALAKDSVYLLRVASPGGRMTGWRLAPTQIGEGEVAMDSIPVYELLARRPGLMAALILPDGWLAYFDGGELVGLVNPQDQLVWSVEGGQAVLPEMPSDPEEVPDFGAGRSSGPRPSPGLDGGAEAKQGAKP